LPTVTTSRTKLALALATVYIAWGSTYLAIRWTVATVPPFLMAGVRFALAGGLLYTILRGRVAPAPRRSSWLAALPVAFALLVVGNGLVCWAEQWVPSGVTALLIASTPLWMVIFPWVTRGRRPRSVLLAGVVAGFAGVGLLIGPSSVVVSGSGRMSLAMCAVLLGSASWAAGSLFSRKRPIPEPPFMSTAMQMLVASPLLLAVGLLHGDLGAISVAGLTGKALLGFGYLVTFGSIIGFGAYVWLLEHTTPARATTYAFVNPAIAVVIGWALGGETLGPRMVLATCLIVGSVVVVIASPQTNKEPELPAAP
jgi:drug/metabolite transporter (DMT)-like permease